VTPGADISFQLHVTESESWVDHVERNDVSRSAAGKSSDLVKAEFPHDAQTNSAARGDAKNPQDRRDGPPSFGDTEFLSNQVVDRGDRVSGQESLGKTRFDRCPNRRASLHMRLPVQEYIQDDICIDQRFPHRYLAAR
jgi:hypothetical protein